MCGLPGPSAERSREIHMDKPNTGKAETAKTYTATDADLPSELFGPPDRAAVAREKILCIAEQMFDQATVESISLLLRALEQEQKP